MQLYTVKIKLCQKFVKNIKENKRANKNTRQRSTTDFFNFCIV